MWKKIGILCIALLGTFSIVYATNQFISATNVAVTYQSGGNVIGRLNHVPANLASGSIPSSTYMQKGDKVLMGTLNPDTQNPLEWILIKEYTYDDYATDGCIPNISFDASQLPNKYNSVKCSTTPITSWRSMTTESVGTINPGLIPNDYSSTSFYKHYNGRSTNFVGAYNKTALYTLLETINADVKSNPTDYQLVNPRNLNIARTMIMYMSDKLNDSTLNTTLLALFKDKSVFMDMAQFSIFNAGNQLGKSLYVPSYTDMYHDIDANGNDFSGVPVGEIPDMRDFGFDKDYWTSVSYSSSGTLSKPTSSLYFTQYNMNSSALITPVVSNGKGYSLTSYDIKKAVRPEAYLNMKDVVFAVSKGITDDFAYISHTTISPTYNNLHTEVSGNDPLKVRVFDPTITMSFSDIQNKEGTSVSKVQEDGKVYLKANASTGNHQVVSVIILNEDNEFVYYKPLESSAGDKNYVFDLKGLPIGKYKIALVNEVYDESDTSPAACSEITDTKNLQIVEPMSISYAPSYKTGVITETANTYEFSKNVAPGDTIGKITYADGVSPYTFKLSSDPNHPSQPDGYKNFEISTLDSNDETTASSASPLSVNIKSNAPDLVTMNSGDQSLKAGDYHFCITAYDANGDPLKEDGNKKLVSCQTVSVQKTTPTVSFTTDTKTTMKIGDSAYEDTITTSNEDLGKVDPNTSKMWVPKYTLENGVINVLSQPSTSMITGVSDANKFKVEIASAYTGSELPHTFDLYVELPETDNYKAVTGTNRAKKQILTYKELSSLTWTATKESFTASEVTSGSKVGELQAVDGLEKFTYEIPTDSAYPDNQYFTVTGTQLPASSKAEVKTNANLSVKEYKVLFKVTDSKNVSKTVEKIIKVSAQSQGTVRFKDDSGNIITTMDITYGDTGKKVLAYVDGTSSGETITYDVAPVAEQAGGIDGADYVSISASRELTTKKVGTVKIKAVSPGNNTYGEASVILTLTIKQAERTIAFANQSNPRKIALGTTGITESTTISKTGSNDTVTYTSDNESVIKIDANGMLTIIGNGTANITATLTDGDGNYKSASCTKVIQVYDGASGTFTQTGTPQAGKNSSYTGVSAGTVTASGGSGANAITYQLGTGAGSENRDKNLFTVDSQAGTVAFSKNISASDLAGKYDSTKKAYVLKVQVDILDSGTVSNTVDCEISIKGEQLSNVTFSGEKNGKIIKTYAPAGAFTVSLDGNTGNGAVTYTIKNDSQAASDVIGPITNNTVTIQNADHTDTTLHKPVIVASIEAAGGYDEGSVEVEVSISKAEQSNFKFARPKIELLPGARITPTFTGDQDTTGAITLSSKDVSVIKIDGNDIVALQKEKADVEVQAVKKGDRNYKDGIATANVTVTAANAYEFAFTVPSAMYGDSNASATIITDNSTLGATLTQAWSSSDESVATIDQNGEITFLSAGTTDITCVQTSDLDAPVRSTVTLEVLKRPITLKYQDYELYTGEALPAYELESSLIDGTLVGSDAVTDFHIPASASASVTNSNTKGTYQITGSYTTEEQKEVVIKNYDVSFKEGTLIIKQDEAKTSWIELKGKTSGKLLNASDWHREDVEIIVKDAKGSAGTYTQMSDDGAAWNTSITVNKEDENKKSLSFRITPDNITSSSIDTTVKIDKTPPVITSMTGETVNENTSSKVLNFLTFGRYFKPGIKVKIEAKDTEKGTRKISGLKEITYTVYEVDETGKVDLENPYDTDIISASASTTLPVLPKGKFEVCATIKDQAGNESSEVCRKLWIRDIGDDTNGDGIPDVNIDINGDGIPDLNITKNPNDKLPYLNIDTTGNGEADMNIDLDGDGVPDLNTGIVDTWVTNQSVDLDKDGEPDYKTSSTLKGINNIDTNDNQIPDLNIDLDLDGIPELNINIDGELKLPQVNVDGNADGKADINIDTNGDGKPNQNVMSISEWNPDMNYIKDGKVLYETMQMKYKPIEELEDNGIVVEPSGGNISFLPNMALKVTDKTESISKDELADIIEKSGQTNSEVKNVYDVKLMEENSVIQPNGSVKVKIPVDTTIKNPKLMMKAKDGTWTPIQAKEENGYYVFETDYIGDVSILGESEEAKTPEPTPEDPKPNPEPTPTTPEDPEPTATQPSTTQEPTQQVSNTPSPTVQGTYTGQSTYPGNNVGGARTGDSTNLFFYIGLICTTLGMLCFVLYRKKSKQRR